MHLLVCPLHNNIHRGAKKLRSMQVQARSYPQVKVAALLAHRKHEEAESRAELNRSATVSHVHYWPITASPRSLFF
eukprot:SAG31_NODE_1671_length_7565_cov_7.868203_2_plen_76_part_00